MSIKISELGAFAGNVADGDLFAIVDVSDTTQAPSGTTKKITAAIIRGAVRSTESWVFGDNSNPYIACSSATWSTLGAVVFRGTDVVGTPSSFKVIAYNNNAGKTTQVRIYDVTNALEIGIVTVTGTAQAIYTDATLANLPTGEAIIEIQAQRVSTGVTVNVYYAGLFWG